MLDTRLIRAEVLKLGRRRGMLALCGGMVFAAVAALMVANAVDPPVGGIERFREAVAVLAMAGAVVGVILGATAGGSDLETRVFRDLVATGRPRLALFAARVPGAWAVVLPLLLAAAAVFAVSCTAFAGSEPAPTAGQLVAGAASVLAAGAFASAVCVGLAALSGSRGSVIGLALSVQLGLSPLLAQIDALGDARLAIPQLAISRIGQAGGLPVELGAGTAVLVLAAYVAASLAAGAWRTATQEI